VVLFIPHHIGSMSGCVLQEQQIWVATEYFGLNGPKFESRVEFESGLLLMHFCTSELYVLSTSVLCFFAPSAIDQMNGASACTGKGVEKSRLAL
jgi:hypothetical protein